MVVKTPYKKNTYCAVARKFLARPNSSYLVMIGFSVKKPMIIPL